jgi:hypothetical protein
VTDSAEPAPDLRLRRDAVRDGWSDDELGRCVRTGELHRLRRGAYINGTLPLDAADRHRLLIRATMSGLRRSAVVSHQSAAVLLGLPLWDVPLDRVHVTRRPRAWNDTGRVLCCHVARLRDDEVIELDGLQLTGPVRTALDLARSSRVIFHRWKLPPSALQFEVRSADGALIGRTDFAWEEHRLVGEFDGRLKYGRLLQPGQHAGDAVFREKQREDAIRDEGWGVIRWTWPDLHRPDRFAARVRRRMN